MLLSDKNHKEKVKKEMIDNLRKYISNLQNENNKRAEKIELLEAEFDVSDSDESLTELVSRPGQSQGLLYKHLCH